MNRFYRTAILGVVLAFYWLAMFVLTHLPKPPPIPGRMGDKSAHFISYGLLAALLFGTLWSARPRAWWMAWAVPLILFAYGALDELLQMMPGLNRSAEFADWVADASGTLIAVAILSGVKWAVGLAKEREAEQVNPADANRDDKPA